MTAQVKKGIKHDKTYHLTYPSESVSWVYKVLGLLKDIQTYHRQIRPKPGDWGSAWIVPAGIPKPCTSS